MFCGTPGDNLSSSMLFPQIIEQMNNTVYIVSVHYFTYVCISQSVQSLIHVWLCDHMDCSMPELPVHHQLPHLAQTHVHRVGVAIQPSHPSVVPFCSCFQSFPASGSFQMSQFFASGGQNIAASASVSSLPVNIQDWFLLGLTGWISLKSKGLSRIFCSTTIQKHHFFSTQPYLWSNSHIHTWPLEKPQLWQ